MASSYGAPQCNSRGSLRHALLTPMSAWDMRGVGKAGEKSYVHREAIAFSIGFALCDS
jgi:hypothetical protein